MLSYWQKIKQRQCIGAATPIHLRRCFTTYTTDLDPHRRISIPFFASRRKGLLSFGRPTPSICQADTV